MSNIFELIHGIVHLVKGAAELEEQWENSKSAPVLSQEKIEEYLLHVCEETTKTLPKNRSYNSRWDQMYVSSRNDRTVTYVLTILGEAKDLSIQGAFAEERRYETNRYSRKDKFENICRAHGVTKKFIINDMQGRCVGQFTLSVKDLKDV